MGCWLVDFPSAGTGMDRGGRGLPRGEGQNRLTLVTLENCLQDTGSIFWVSGCCGDWGGTEGWTDTEVVSPDWHGEVSLAVPQWLSLLQPAPLALVSRWF